MTSNPGDPDIVGLVRSQKWSSPSFTGASITLQCPPISEDAELHIRGILVADIFNHTGGTDFTTVDEDKPGLSLETHVRRLKSAVRQHLLDNPS